MRNSCRSSLGRCRCAKANGVVDVLVCRCLKYTVSEYVLLGQNKYLGYMYNNIPSHEHHHITLVDRLSARVSCVG